MNGQNIRIRLKAFDHRILDASTRENRFDGQAHRRFGSWSGAASYPD